MDHAASVGLTGTPVLSVVIPLGDVSEKAFRETLASLSKAGVFPLEVVVVHSAGLSPPLEDCEILAMIDKYLYVEDEGIYDAYNKGIAAASGTWVLFFGQGDCFLGGKELIGLLIGVPCETYFIACSCSKSSAPGIFYDPVMTRPHTLPTSHQALLTRRDLLVARPFDLRWKIAADYDHYKASILSMGADIVHASSSRLAIVAEGGFSEENFPALILEYKELVRKYCSVRQYIYFRIAISGFLWPLIRLPLLRKLFKPLFVKLLH